MPRQKRNIVRTKVLKTLTIKQICSYNIKMHNKKITVFSTTWRTCYRIEKDIKNISYILDIEKAKI